MSLFRTLTESMAYMTSSDVVDEITDYAERQGVEILFQIAPFGADNEIEVTDFNALVTGYGAGTRVMIKLCQAADRSDINLYVLPGSYRNRDFYSRFGFEAAGHRAFGVGGLMMRYPVVDYSDDEIEDMDPAYRAIVMARDTKSDLSR
jgi:hypothetical protein